MRKAQSSVTELVKEISREIMREGINDLRELVLQKQRSIADVKLDISMIKEDLGKHLDKETGSQATVGYGEISRTIRQMEGRFKGELDILNHKADGIRNDLKFLTKEFNRHVDNKVSAHKVLDQCLQKSGQTWSEREDRQLREEVDQGLDLIARSHGRSSWAIQCRIKDKGLLKI